MEQGTRIGDYEILGELGRGGMGRVYRVRNVISDRHDAMKVLLPGIVIHDDFVARFQREIRLLAALEHPNICALRTALSTDGQVAMVMELVEGRSLSKRLTEGPLPESEAIAYAQQILAALAYAHQRGVIHRDIKPANVMVTAEGLVKLTDFGIARSVHDQGLTATGTTAGSVGYMSPEQVNGETVDERSDLYSLGITLYEMVAGRPPFKSLSEFGMMAAHVTETPRPPVELRPDLSRELNDIILRAIAKRPEDRFQSAEAFRSALAFPVEAERAARAMPAVVPAPPAGAMAASAATVISPPRTRVSSEAEADELLSPEPSRAAITSRPQTPASHVRDTQPPVPPPPGGRDGAGHRLLYVALGAVLVVVAAAGTGAYLRRAEAGADPVRTSPATQTNPVTQTDPATLTNTASQGNTAGQANTAVQGSTVSDTGASVPGDVSSLGPTTAEIPLTPATSTAGGAGLAGVVRQQSSGTLPLQPASITSTTNATAQAAGVGTATPSAVGTSPVPNAPQQGGGGATNLLADLEDEVDQLTIRAEVVSDSLQRLRDDQARQGLGLRGDIAAQESALNLNLSRAADAIARQDLARARQYTDRAQTALQALEKFFGR